MGSVLKPTQVGEASSLRCSRELWLRNSANWLRNFGIRSATAGDGTCSLSWLGSQKPGPSDCLPKTQERANTKVDVYALTPARCWNVKRRG